MMSDQQTCQYMWCKTVIINKIQPCHYFLKSKHGHSKGKKKTNLNDATLRMVKTQEPNCSVSTLYSLCYFTCTYLYKFVIK